MGSQKTNNPIVFLDVVVHYGGSKQVTVNLARHIQHKHPTVVIDAYGNCDAYISALYEAGINTKIIMPHGKKGIIGGRGFISRLLKIVASIPDFILLINRLRKILDLIKPLIVIVSCEKALFLATHSLPGRIPVLYYLMGESFGHPWYNMCSWRDVNLVVSLSQSCMMSLDNYGQRLGHTAVVYNGIDVDEVVNLSQQPTEALPGTNRSLKVLLPASIIPIKAQDIAVRAVAMCRDAGLDIQLWLSSCRPRGTGKGYAGKLLDLISELKLEDRVSFIGWRENIYPVMSASDVILLVSKSEGMPCCLMEAMALQKPVIATRVGGVPEFVRDNVDGLLVSSGDTKSIYEALKKLSDGTVRSQMGKLGCERIKQSFTIQKQVGEFMKCIYCVVDKKEQHYAG